MDKVVLPVRVMALLGAKTVILTNAAGSLDLSLQPGSLMCINDQIASFIPSPLIGPCDERIGTRFPEMTRIYSKVLIALAHRVADDLGIKLHDGTYLQITGPAFETNAESRLYAMLGGNAVGMSTACEAIALHNLNIDILGISCITDMAIENDRITTHEEVQKKAKEASAEFKKLVRRIVSKI
jgi:purine-nucleoside phosphorylase